VVTASEGQPADYLLVGRLGAAGPEYALVKDGARASEGSCSLDFQPPVRGEWTPAATAVAARQAAVALDDMALRIGRVVAWLTFKAPQDDPDYPWKLQLSVGGRPIEGQTVKPESRIALELVRTGPGVEQRFPYVFAIDCKGAIDVAWPEPGREPSRLPGVANPSLERVPLGEVELDATRGRYTFLLVATDEQLPSVEAIVQPGVRRGAPDASSPLAAALLGMGLTRGISRAPKRFAVERVGFVAAP
jgi:hypothetical protein